MSDSSIRQVEPPEPRPLSRSSSISDDVHTLLVLLSYTHHVRVAIGTTSSSIPSYRFGYSHRRGHIIVVIAGVV